MKRPLVMVALFYTGGILLAEFISLPLQLLFVSALAFALAALFWSRFRPFLLAPLLVLTGMANATQHTATVSPHDLRIIVGTNAAIVTVRGTLVETPYERVHQRGGFEESWRTSAQLDVEAIHDDASG